jgi:hypothetical protein
VHIQHAKLELEGERVVLKYIKVDKVAYYDRKIAKEVFELELNKSIITLMKEEDMQHQVRDNSSKCQSRNNGKYQQKDKLDLDIDEIWMLMMRVPKRRHTKVRRMASDEIQFTERIYISEESGQQQHKLMIKRS